MESAERRREWRRGGIAPELPLPFTPATRSRLRCRHTLRLSTALNPPMEARQGLRLAPN